MISIEKLRGSNGDQVFERHPLSEATDDFPNLTINCDMPGFNPDSILMATERVRNALKALNLSGTEIVINIEERVSVQAGMASARADRERARRVVTEFSTDNFKQQKIIISIYFDKGEFNDNASLAGYLDGKLRKALLSTSTLRIKENGEWSTTENVDAIVGRYAYLFGRLVGNRGKLIVPG